MVLLEAGLDVAIDEQVRSVAVMLTQAARESARPESIPRLERLIRNARQLDAEAEPQGAMVSHGGSGDVGVAGALIRRWQDKPDPTILFTGHVASGTTGRRLVESGRALFQRWNVHPRASDNLALIDSVKPQRIIPAFGEGKYAAFWQARMAQRQECEVLTARRLCCSRPKWAAAEVRHGPHYCALPMRLVLTGQARSIVTITATQGQ